MSDYATKLLSYTDDQVAEELSYKIPGSVNHEMVKFEMQRRMLISQKLAADATLRSAIAAERYTRATWFLILVTTVGLIANLVAEL